jgi:Tfp pilus assembly protein PilN
MRINLLPPEVRQRQSVRRRTAAVVAAGVVVLAGVAALYFLQQLRLVGVNNDLEDQRAANSGIQAQINDLRRFDELQREVEASRTMLSTLMANEILWSGVLRDVSLVIPSDVWLSGMTAQTNESGGAVSPAPATPVAGQPGQGLVGQITFNGFALDHRAVALWLARLDDVRGFANPWLSNAQKTDVGTSKVVQFASSVDLSQQAVARGRRAR